MTKLRVKESASDIWVGSGALGWNIRLAANLAGAMSEAAAGDDDDVCR